MAIYNHHYADTFEFPEFERFIVGALVEDLDGKVITVGGIRPIAETVIMTDKNCHARKRWAAIIEMLQAGEYFARKSNFRELHCFVQDEIWLKHLLKLGFQKTSGICLVKQLEAHNG